MQHANAMTLEQKRGFYRDGYVILNNVVPQDMVDAARSRIESRKEGENLAKAQEMTDLVNATAVTPILNDAMGRFDPPIAAQVGVIPVSKPGKHFNNLGYRDKHMPYYGAQTHVDGNITIRAPQEVQQGTPEEIYLRYFANGPRGDLGRSPEVIGHNLVPMFEDPEMTLGLGSFTAFVIVCLNDQMIEGCGQTALLKGAHHSVERLFRWQHETNGRLGPEGPGWPRLNYDAPNRCGLVYLPSAVAEEFIDETSESTPDGRRWPRPTQVLMEPGRRLHHDLPDSPFGHPQRTRHGVAQEHHLPHPQQEPATGQAGQRHHRPPGPRPVRGVAGLRGGQRSLGAVEVRHVPHVARVGRHARGCRRVERIAPIRRTRQSQPDSCSSALPASRSGIARSANTLRSCRLWVWISPISRGYQSKCGSRRPSRS